MSNMNMTSDEHMYMNIGAGIGAARNWSKNSFALDAMTMGFYLKKIWVLKLVWG